MTEQEKEKGQEKTDKALNKLWQELLKRKPTNDHLLSVVLNIESLRNRAMKQLWEQGATKEDLSSIMISVDDPSFTKTVQRFLDVRNARNEEIQKILEKMRSIVEPP